jgi:hypothetical protein
MWQKSHTIVTKEATKEQIWKLFSDVNNWHQWDKGIEYAKMTGEFKKGNNIDLRPNGGPRVKIEIIHIEENKRFICATKFPLAVMCDDHIFEDTKDGLKITISISVKGLFSFIWRKLVAQKIVDNLPEEMCEQIKAASIL